jgi:hypothetical protein
VPWLSSHVGKQPRITLLLHGDLVSLRATCVREPVPLAHLLEHQVDSKAGRVTLPIQASHELPQELPVSNPAFDDGGSAYVQPRAGTPWRTGGFASIVLLRSPSPAIAESHEDVAGPITRDATTTPFNDGAST